MKRFNAGLFAAVAVFSAALFGAAVAQQSGPRPPVGAVGIAPPIQPDEISKRIVAQRQSILDRITPVTDAMLLNPPAGEWLNWRRTYDVHGFSPLSEITPANAGTLQTAWSWSLTPATTQVTPLVHDGVIFVYGANDNVQALDATNGELLWWYTRPGSTAGRSSGGASVHRSIAIYQDKIIFATDDKHEVALNVKTGKVVWDHAFPDGDKWRMSSGPLVAKGKVIQGTTGCPAGGCPVIALDAKTGEEVWRFYTVAHAGQPGDNSWNGLPDSQRFGASVWTTPSFDPQLNLVYVATGNTYHWQELWKGGPDKKPGNNRDGLYVDSTIALDADTGKLRWSYQHLPEDYWDLDFAFEQTIATIPVNGKPRKVVCSTGKMVWTDCVDAATGKFVFAHDLGLQNIIKSHDPKTGRKTYNEETIPDLTGKRRNLQCSAGYGDKNWPAGSFNAKTNTMFMSLTEVCGESAPTMFGPNEQAYTQAQETRIARYQPGSDGNIGRLDAIDLATRKSLWSVRQRASMVSAVVATDGGVIFAGDADRWFRAYDQTNGKVLWQARLNDVVNSYPVTYAVNGKQYVAVVTGCCGNGRLNNMHQLTPEIVAPRGNASAIWVFALPAK